MMLIAIIAPECMVGLATRQWFAARRLSKKFGFSKTHAFFFVMGGFVGPSGYVVATTEQLGNQETLNDIISIDAEDIKDKGKGDTFSKGVALVQVLWFTTHCLARVHQHLAVTELEVATMGFAVMNVFTWILWWDKPLGVERQIVVGPPQRLLPCKKLPFSVSLPMVFFGTESIASCGAQGLTSVPDFWSPTTSESVDLSHVVGIGIMPLLTGAIFGAIHCAAWRDDFPTTAEVWIWRVSSLVIVSMPVAWSSVLLIGGPGLLSDRRVFDGHRHFTIAAGSLFVLFASLYPVARLFLLVLPFTALRSLPPSAFVDVDWDSYIPHL
ncbi:hypothetical protein FB45DRAFT_805901 [Roridomyces roridus]|uniref:Uncharacterized protein n=1 Tax=Roridomyces roridus TaxID=1738132 RepID=A0AAD7B2F1_9AGAR|nr:hypothetical protein FB45DRAFT_805901 [Roridomyces roridus]